MDQWKYEIAARNLKPILIGHNTLMPRQNCSEFADDIFKRIFLEWKCLVSIKISLKFIPKGPTDNMAALVQIMAWCLTGDKPLSEQIYGDLFYWRIYASRGLNVFLHGTRTIADKLCQYHASWYPASPSIDRQDINVDMWQICNVLLFSRKVNFNKLYIDGLVQERRNSIANAPEVRLLCINLSIYMYCFNIEQ